MISRWIGKSVRFFAVIVGVGALGNSARAVDQSSWGRWEQALTSGQSSLTALDAYRLEVEATYWAKSGPTCVEPTPCCLEPTTPSCTNTTPCFKGRAFWDGTGTDTRPFKIRSAFPAGDWCWKTCRLPRQGTSCTADTGLNASGEVHVTNPSGARNALYTNGFLKAPASKRNLTYWNGQTPFQWIGDTAWNAPINYATTQAMWRSYVAARAAGGFSNVLVAPAVQTTENPPPTPPGAPPVFFKGFVQPSGCNGGSPPIVPSSCHYWDSAYWRSFEQLVLDANDAGILVVVADMMDPLNRGGSNQSLEHPVKFPAPADAAAFARNLAARLAGSFVAFSPSFDARTTDTAAGGTSVPDLINAVGSAIRSAAPRHLIGVHLAGGSAFDAYDQFQTTGGWLSLQLFQSGHGGGTCSSDTDATNDYAQFACRARTFALRFRCIGEPATNLTCSGSGAPADKPIKPAVNVEGQYESPGNELTRVQTRHTAWNSGLSGSFGFNIGVVPDISAWTNPTTYAAANHRSDDDLTKMRGLFKALPWSNLTPQHDWLIEQNSLAPSSCTPTAGGQTPKASWLQLWKPHLALESNAYGLAYLPRPTNCTSPGFTPSRNIVLNRSKANAFGIRCANFKGTWVSAATPAQFADVKAVCTERGSTITISPKTTIACGESCDRVLVITRQTTSAANSPVVAGPLMVDLEPDVVISEDGLSSTIVGQASRNGLDIRESIRLSGLEPRFRKLPSAALDAAGNFLVAWEEESDAGTDDIVAARFDSRLKSLGEPFLLNDTTAGQQAEPWVSGDDSSQLVVVWTSYSEDDKIGGDIYGKLIDKDGAPINREFLITVENQGNQFLPQVQMIGGGKFVVSWTEDTGSGSEKSLDGTSSAVKGERSSGVYYRVFAADGRPRGPQHRVDTGNRRARLSRLEAHPHGGFTIHWRESDARGRERGERARKHDSNGYPVDPR